MRRLSLNPRLVAGSAHSDSGFDRSDSGFARSDSDSDRFGFDSDRFGSGSDRSEDSGDSVGWQPSFRLKMLEIDNERIIK